MVVFPFNSVSRLQVQLLRPTVFLIHELKCGSPCMWAAMVCGWSRVTLDCELTTPNRLAKDHR